MIRIFAHRGASGSHPENTLAAFQEAMDAGADAIELDVQLTRDRELVVFHDETLQRLAGRPGRVIDHTLQALQQIDVGARMDPAFEGERIPSFDEALDLIPDDILLNIHVIAYAYTRDILVPTFARRMSDRQAWRRGFITSDAQTLKGIRRAYPKAEICSLTRLPDPFRYLRHSVELGCRAIQPLRQMITPEFVEAAHQAGLAVNVVYANTEETMRELIEMEVDGIFTRHPRLLKRVLEETAGESTLSS